MGVGARVSDFFFTQNPNLKKKKFFFFVGGGGGGGEVGCVWRCRWMDRRTGPNQFAPSPFNFFEVGGITMH